MTGEDEEFFEESAEDLLENAPCGYLSTRPDGTIIKANRTFASWTGFSREELLRKRFQDLLSAGARIYHETHSTPLLHMQGSVSEIAVEIVRADGSRLPALVNSVMRRDEAGRPGVIRTTVFDATDRRRYEEELMRLRRREQDIAQQLQRSMLSETLPAAPGLDLAFAYRPGVRGLDVGGDWYDAFWLDEGETVGLVVGDVVGRGIGAAATMGQLRSAVRALASTGLRPGQLLDALDEYARRHDVGKMATLVCAQLSLRSGRLRFACAGHPPPAIMVPREDPCFAWDGRSLPLDVRSEADGPREEGARSLTPGTVVVLYTDGIVERRAHSLDAGMDRLLDKLAAHRDDAAATLVEAAVRDLHDPDHADDTCMLAARLEPAGPDG